MHKTITDKYKNEIIKDGYIVPRELYELWQVEMEILDKVDEICRANGIKYFLMSGSLIGAVRHKGFIPWDDDIDIMMTRENYELFAKIAQSALGDQYFFQNTYTDKTLYREHAQVRKNGTAMFVRNDYKKKYNRGVFIDIFICDKVPFDTEKIIKLRNEINRRNKLIKYAYVKIGKNIKTIIKKILGKLYLLFKGGKKRAFASLEKLAKKYASLTEYGYSDVIFVLDERVRVYDSADVENVCDFEFEDRKYMCPLNALKVLIEHFDENVMTPSRQPTVHGGLYWDLNRSYIEYDRLNKKEFEKLFENDYVSKVVEINK